jgi:hypothetical protein
MRLVVGAGHMIRRIALNESNTWYIDPTAAPPEQTNVVGGPGCVIVFELTVANSAPVMS